MSRIDDLIANYERFVGLPWSTVSLRRSASGRRCMRPRKSGGSDFTSMTSPLAEAERLAGLQKEPRDIDLPPWQKGRYGSAIGRAVHGVMQTIDLATGEGLEDAVKMQASAEGVEGKEDVIEALCRSALASDVVKRAAAREHWREIYVGVPHPTYGVLEGYIDLLYRDDDGLVIVDYKTDSWRNEDDLNDKVERYAVQLGAYADAVSDAVGEPVVRSLLVFAAGDGAAREV